ncbi:nucleotidyltransferase [Mucilaginibacter phyllosphaerae]|uniref:Nucleotidyltransferase family protein n=1 Tax=Mucilaginibacter phyllosphaerae TaxID=1812349 RepID=A0A4Y8A799_9SPHI|nr:nucleotidyltransferase [Mucilaginibacter phyllosphaerae]MBB3970826.1 hypothetical protein [Mucilaginibacter phyllosphaerae]TEW64236.1 hypothetical protein E2R65_17970 [Mucilaginibacter phyllosphaerae]GGH04849.1 hypothetical protein GCM10007352_08290 [Mucilaginibacter phyllosphaerae]
MDIFDEDILSFWTALQKNNVQYIIIGGYAINFHGFQRFTGDMDVWLKDTLENRVNLRKAFISCDMGDYPMLEYMQFIAGWTEFRLKNGMSLDLMVDMKGLEGYTFDECLKMASVADIEGVSVPFLHINQLIQNKKIINRPKDQIDINALEEIKKLRENS